MPRISTDNYDTVASWNGSQDLFVVEQPDGTKVATPAMVKQFMEAGDFEATGEIIDGHGNILKDMAKSADVNEVIGDLSQTGLTGDSVAEQLGDAKGQIVTVDSRVSAFTLGAPVDITSYSTPSNRYTCPSDGYLRLVVNGGGSGWVMVNGQSTISSTGSSSGNTVVLCMFVKKGMTVYLGAGNQTLLYFIPLS